MIVYLAIKIEKNPQNEVDDWKPRSEDVENDIRPFLLQACENKDYIYSLLVDSYGE